MKIFEIVGNVTLSRCHPDFTGARLLAAHSVGDQLLGRAEDPEPELLIVWDEQGAGLGCRVAVSDGGEAAGPFRPKKKAVDAYVSAILDQINIDPNVIKQLK